MRRFGIAAAACALALCAAPTTAAPQRAAAERGPPDAAGNLESPAPTPAARQPASRYFIEFRSRSALSYGHTFVVFGRLGEKLTAKNVAGLHPKGDSSVTYMIGHLLLVPADTGASDGDLDEQYLTARYRLTLSAADYRAVVSHIRELQASSPAWNAVTYNCNAFVGIIAHFVGLKSPPTWLFPEDFINSMRRMNDERQHAAVRMSESGAASRAWARQISNKR